MLVTTFGGGRKKSAVVDLEVEAEVGALASFLQCGDTGHTRLELTSIFIEELKIHKLNMKYTNIVFLTMNCLVPNVGVSPSSYCTTMNLSYSIRSTPHSTIHAL